MRRATSILLVLAVLVTVGATYLAGRAGPAPAAHLRTQEIATPQVRQLVCPTSDTDTVSHVGLLPSTPSGGSVVAGEGPLSIQPGQVAEFGTPGRTPLVVTARQQATRGVFGSREQTSPTGGASRCGSPRASWWFTGAGASPSHFSTVELVNPRPGAAVVDISVWGPQGPVPGAGLRGISVRAGATRSVRLADTAPSAGSLAVHVQASRGLVVADVADHTLDVLDPKAQPTTEWIPDAIAPARRVVLSGIPPPNPGDAPTDASSLPSGLSPGGSLVVFNPGLTNVVAQVRLSSSGGTFAPVDQQPVTVPPGTAVAVPFGGAIENDGTAVVVDADGPVTAGYLVAGKTDLFHAVPGVHWQGPAAVAMPADGTPSLLLTADRGAGRVAVTELAADGSRIVRRVVPVAARSTLRFALRPRAASVIVSSRGQVVGSVQVQRGSAYAALPVTPVLAALRIPAVRPGS